MRDAYQETARITAQSDIRSVVVPGSATGFAQEILAGPHRMSADEPNALRFAARRILGRLYFDYLGNVRPAERMAARGRHCQSAAFEDTRHRLCRVRNERRNPESD